MFDRNVSAGDIRDRAQRNVQSTCLANSKNDRPLRT